MIVLDMEASSPDNGKGGIWQIGAIELDSGEEFFEEARIDEDDEISEEALLVIGKTEKELRDSNKQTQKELIEKFLTWTEKFEERIIIGHNIGWDSTFLSNKCMRYGIGQRFKDSLSYRSFDISTLAQAIYYKENKKFKTKNGKNDMNSTNIFAMFGIEDNRVHVNKGDIIKEGTPHNALEDAKNTAKCFEELIKKL